MSTHSTETNIVRVDNYTRLCLTLIAVLLTVMVIGLWANHTPIAEEAQAAQPFANASAQRVEMLKQQRITNQKLDKLISVLQSGEVVVTVQEKETPAAKGGDNATNAEKTK